MHAFTVAGELDHATAEQLRGPLLEAIAGGADGILVDLSECHFIDSTGLSVLVEARRLLGDRNGGPSFGICCADPQVRRLLEITGLDRALEMHETREEALAALAAAG